MAFPLSVSDILALTALATHVSTALLSAPHRLRTARHKIDALVLEVEQARALVAAKSPLLAARPDEAARLQRFLAIFDGALRDCSGILERYGGGEGGKKMGGVGKVKWVVADEKRFEDILTTLEFVVTRFDSFLARMDAGLDRPGRVEVEQEEDEDEGEKEDRAPSGGGKAKPESAYAKAVEQRQKEGGHDHARVPGTRLECYTLLRATGVMGGKLTCEREQRGQWKLREMAQDFRRAAQYGHGHGGVGKDDERVAWLLRARADDERDPRYRWVFLAARLEKKGTVGFVATEEVMVIVRREMTAAAKRETPCHQGAACYRPDCPYKHPPPCHYRGGCRRPACGYKHPAACRTVWGCRTPGCRYSHLTLCRRGRHCDVADCRYVHRDKALCWNGIECKTAGCVYTHVKIQCRYRPCRTPDCSFNHLPGQVQTPESIHEAEQTNKWPKIENQLPTAALHIRT